MVIFGLFGCLLSGLGYFLVGLSTDTALLSLSLLCAGRIILGIRQSFAGTGSTLWGVVGSLHIGRVISWNGIATYVAMATYTVFMDLSLGITGPLAAVTHGLDGRVEYLSGCRRAGATGSRVDAKTTGFFKRASRHSGIKNAGRCSSAGVSDC